MGKAIHVVGAVFVAGSRVLACRRSPERSDGGRWEFPGGKVVVGETARRALAREIAEELGVAVVVGDRIDRSTTGVDGRLIDLECLLISTTSALPSVSSDHHRLEWIGRGALGSLEWARPDLPAVRRLVAMEPWPETTIDVDVRSDEGGTSGIA